VSLRWIFVVTLLAAPSALLARAGPAAPVALVAPVAPATQSDLDDFMGRVLTRRDENWKKLQQYVLDEEERLHVFGPGGAPLYGFTREYTWFIRQGYFIRSPVRFDGVRITDEERARQEERWIEREKSRERRVQERAKERVEEQPQSAEAAPPDPSAPVDVLRYSLEPQFVSAAYFLRFKFEPGHYALAGRERLSDRDVLRIEYYPSLLFNEGRSRPDKRVRERDDQIEEKMNKVSLITMWIDPSEHQILQYTFDNIDMDFLPGRSLVRVDEMKASMKMLQPFPNVWLPGAIDMSFLLTTAMGSIEASYDVEYHDYRLAEVTTRIRP
jgi:hypothetical protein